jgi:hypothetical protein
MPIPVVFVIVRVPLVVTEIRKNKKSRSDVASAGQEESRNARPSDFDVSGERFCALVRPVAVDRMQIERQTVCQFAAAAI